MNGSWLLTNFICCLPPCLPPSLPPFLSIYVSLWLQDTCHLMPFTKQHNAYAWVVTSILFLINLTFHTLSLHSSYKIHQHSPTIHRLFFPTTLLRAAWKTSFSLSGQPSSSVCVYYIYMYTCIYIPVVPHKAVAEVSKIGNYRRGDLLWCMDGRANPLMRRKVVVIFGVVAAVASPTTAGCSVAWRSAM